MCVILRRFRHYQSCTLQFHKAQLTGLSCKRRSRRDRSKMRTVFRFPDFCTGNSCEHLKLLRSVLKHAVINLLEIEVAYLQAASGWVFLFFLLDMKYMA